MSKKISKATARKWANRFKRDGRGASSGNIPLEAIQSIINQPGVKGVRVYNAFDEDTRQYTMFIVGTDANGNNLLPTTEDQTEGEQYSIEDDIKVCPPNCPDNDL